VADGVGALLMGAGLSGYNTEEWHTSCTVIPVFVDFEKAH